MKLSRPGGPGAADAGQGQAAQDTAKPAAKGWGGKPAAQDPAQEDQRDRIKDQLTGNAEGGEGKSDGARSAFSGGVSKLRESIQQEHGGEGSDTHNGVRGDGLGAADAAKEAETPRRTRSAKEPAAPTAPVFHFPDSSPATLELAKATQASGDALAHAMTLKARAALMASLVPVCANPEEAAEMFDALWDKVAAPF